MYKKNPDLYEPVLGLYIYIDEFGWSFGFPTPNLQILSSNGACLYLKLKGAAKTKNYGKPASFSKPMDLSQEKKNGLILRDCEAHPSSPNW